MGTCMSKDKKGATSATHIASTSSCSSSSLSSQGKQLRPPSQDIDSTVAKVRPSNAEESLTVPISRPSCAVESKEPTSTDKHVVEIRLPIASPSKFKASPASETLAARAMAAIARPPVEESTSVQSRDDDEEEEEQEAEDEKEEEDEEEEEEEESEVCCDRDGPSKLRHPSPPLFYSSYLNRASFSRDLAAFSRDIASLSSSPLMRSPSVNGAHDLIAAAIKAAHSPHYAHNKPHSNMIFDDYTTSTRSRSLPKRFYARDSNSNLPLFHKRSSSRDAAMEHQKFMKRKPMVDPPCELSLSPRISVRREEASGEYRVGARQAAARKSHHQHGAKLASSKASDAGLLWKKERSPMRRSSTGKVADADQVKHELHHFQENQNFTQTMHCGASILNQSRGKPPLMERSSNCSSWGDATNQGFQGPFKNFKNVAKAKAEPHVQNEGLDRSMIDDGGLKTEATPLECANSSLYYSGKPPRVSASDQSDTIAMPMDRVRSLIEALADLNMESSLLSEIEESETEFEGEINLLQFAFDAGFSPRKELRAQQARNMLLKEAAMDAFARPSFHTSVHPEGLDDSKLPSSDLAALMSTRLTEAEVDTLKIRKVLKLLSNAESEMGKEQKTLFYKQLRTVLDSVKTQTLADNKNSQRAISLADNMKEKTVTARANSWPRGIKEPTHIASKQTPSQESSSPKVLSAIGGLPTTTQMQEELSLKHPESVLQAIEPCKSDDLLQVSVQKTCGDLDFSRRLSSEFTHLGKLKSEANEDIVHQAHKSLIIDVSSAYESQEVQALLGEDYCGAEIAKKLANRVLDGIDDFLAKDIQDERGIADNVEIAVSTSPDRAMVGGRLSNAGVLDQPLSTSLEMKKVCSHDVQCGDMGCTAQSEGKGCAVAGEDACEILPHESSQHGLDVHSVEDMHCDIRPPEHLHCDDDVIGCFLISNVACRGDDVASDGSFEFRVRSSTASTPLSTPSTPMISTASTPRQLTQLDPPLTAQEIAEIWEAFE